MSAILKAVAAITTALARLNPTERTQALELSILATETPEEHTRRIERVRKRRQRDKAGTKAGHVPDTNGTQEGTSAGLSADNPSPSLHSPSPSAALSFSGSSPEREEKESTRARTRRVEAAFVRGVSRGKRGPFAMPLGQAGALLDAIDAHAKNRAGIVYAGDVLERWVDQTAEDFAAWLLAQPARELDVYSAFGPRGFLRWLNATPAPGLAGTVIPALTLNADAPAAATGSDR